MTVTPLPSHATLPTHEAPLLNARIAVEHATIARTMTRMAIARTASTAVHAGMRPDTIARALQLSVSQLRAIAPESCADAHATAHPGLHEGEHSPARLRAHLTASLTELGNDYLDHTAELHRALTYRRTAIQQAASAPGALPLSTIAMCSGCSLDRVAAIIAEVSRAQLDAA